MNYKEIFKQKLVESIFLESRAEDAAIARLQRKSGVDLGHRGTTPETEGITPAGEAAVKRQMQQQLDVQTRLGGGEGAAGRANLAGLDRLRRKNPGADV